MCLYQLKDEEVNLMVKAFQKVWAGLDQLK